MAYASAMLAAPALSRRKTGAATIDARTGRILAAAMLGVAAVRPLVPFEFVPPCPLRTITGIPCPLCGMTRGVTALVHGDVARAVLLNPGVLLAVLGAIFLLVQWRFRRVIVPYWVVVPIFGALWTWQLYKYASGRPL